MNNIILTGQLICQSDHETAVVTEFLPRHLELTLAGSGCISFAVEQSDNPWVWDVSESFQDARSFELHQARVKASDWGRATANIKRSYSVSGL
ncbi:antibiotic biosynthesis monooxygenase [Arthrobacter sp. TMP15]|uniref:putative quinol monooxygenase n=1 Tax=Arthrobacter sp. TMP15 TaxID=3140789 RepID=UPI0031BB3E4D